MNNKEFIAELSRRTGYNQSSVRDMIRTTVDAMTDVFGKGENLIMPGFGQFEVKKRLERIVVNPSTGQRMMVPPKLILNFKPVVAVKQQLKKGGDDE
jgi:nucleoid DNA-binding protein